MISNMNLCASLKASFTLYLHLSQIVVVSAVRTAAHWTPARALARASRAGLGTHAQMSARHGRTVSQHCVVAVVSMLL